MGIVRLCISRIKSIDEQSLVHMLNERTKNKHTLVYYLFLRKLQHNELTEDEKNAMADPEDQKKAETLQSTAECLTAAKD